MTCGDVKKNQFVCTLGLITRRELDRVSRITKIKEVDPLDNTTLIHIQARDDAFGQQ